jgi:hypothetical protein
MMSKGDQDMQYQDDRIAYVFEVWAMRTLDVLRTQLYDDRPLSGGQRRELANALDTIMTIAQPIEVGSLSGQETDDDEDYTAKSYDIDPMVWAMLFLTLAIADKVHVSDATWWFAGGAFAFGNLLNAWNRQHEAKQRRARRALTHPQQ